MINKPHIKIEFDDSEIKLCDEEGNDLEPISDMQCLASKSKIKEETWRVILTHSSPGCIWIQRNGVWYMICR